jgi:asparagine synthase (glutamine-hydrolysing)
MCGIAGFTNPAPDASHILAAMNAALGHRGPDGNGAFIDESVALGHTRLAIIDVLGGAQPRVDETSGDALVFNGEIFGYRALAAELRRLGAPLRDHSDTEVLFHLIRRDGIRRAIERIDGMFAFAFRDGATGSLYLVRDRFGEKPLYYGTAGADVVFASEVPALQCHPAFTDAAPDLAAPYSFLLCEYLPGAASGWQGIAKLEPGTILTAKHGEITIDRYWQPRLKSGRRVNHPEEEAIDYLDQLLAASLRDRVVADVPIGVFLSGGLDSSLITAFALKASPDLTAFSVRVGQNSFDETQHAIEVARHLGVRHHVVTLDSADLMVAFDAISEKLGEPLADSSLLPTYLVCRAARSLMTVALGGDGADELFLGYPNFVLQRFAPAMRLIPALAARLVERATDALPQHEGYMNCCFLARQLAQGFGAPVTRQSFLWMAPFGPSRMAALWRRSVLFDAMRNGAFAAIDRRAAEAGDVTSVERLAYQFLTTYLPENILAKTDRASMFNGLEVRAPFLSRALAEYSCALPTALKLRRGEKKYILKRLACRYLPEPIAYRKKHGFAIPIGRLIRTLFWTRCQDMLLSTSNPVAPWFKRPAIEALLAEHATGRADHGKQLWALYILYAVAGRRRQRLSAAPAAAMISAS